MKKHLAEISILLVMAFNPAIRAQVVEATNGFVKLEPASVGPLDVPQEVAKDYVKQFPDTIKLTLVAYAEASGNRYYLIWGGGRGGGDSEAAYRVSEAGEVQRINGRNYVLPPDNYIDDTALVAKLFDNRVERESHSLGKEPLQSALMERASMPYLMAQAYLKAGFQLDPKTILFVKDKASGTVGSAFPTGK